MMASWHLCILRQGSIVVIAAEYCSPPLKIKTAIREATRIKVKSVQTVDEIN